MHVESSKLATKILSMGDPGMKTCTNIKRGNEFGAEEQNIFSKYWYVLQKYMNLEEYRNFKTQSLASSVKI